MNPTSVAARPHPSDRLPVLDGLRALSILMVLASHFISAQLFPGGLGVLIFFAISGFLITRLLIEETRRNSRVNIKNFYVRRLLRLYPVIVVYCAAVILLRLVQHGEVNAVEPLSALFYFANYYYSTLLIAGTEPSMPFGIFWSLSVEEHFYIFFPVIFALLFRWPRVLMAVVGLLVIGPLAGRLAFVAAHADDIERWHWATYYWTQFRIDSIACGVLLALVSAYSPVERLARHLANPALFLTALGVLAATLLYRDPIFRESVRYSIQSLAVVVLLAGLLFGSARLYAPIRQVLDYWPIVWIGKLSYSLYLWHFIANDLVEPLIPAGTAHAVTIMADFAVSFGLAAISYYLIEMPFVGLRRRFGSHARPDGVSEAPLAAVSR